ncbi:MAG TPA: hypothetical protein VG266_08110 [Candidatus Dormibacteraeota bacterium]|jgi:hypothetical protein|nr:hypothetical protein [Candidatus Dormibacteraeota bacterium]
MPEFARVITVQGSPDKVDEAARYVKETVIPRASTLPGFRRGFWLMDRASGGGKVVTVFESKEALDSSAATAEQLRATSAAALGITFSSVENYEVVAEAGPPRS